MTVSPLGLSLESLTLPLENLAEHERIYNRFMTAYPGADPIEQGYIDQAVAALIEKRRIERSLGVLRNDKVRTAELFFDRAQEDYVSKCKEIFSQRCEWAMREMTRTAAGCRWCIKMWVELDQKLKADGTWYGNEKYASIMLQGESAVLDLLRLSEVAYTTWVDCLVCNPNPKQDDIDKILDPAHVPKALLDRDVTLWPGNPAESRVRLHAIVDRELPRLRALEETLRVQYEEPARAEARQMALARISREETTLLRAGQMAEQSYQRAATALQKARKASAAAGPPVRRRPRRNQAAVGVSPVEPQPKPPGPAPAPHPHPESGPVTGRSAHRTLCPGPGPSGGPKWTYGNASDSLLERPLPRTRTLPDRHNPNILRPGGDSGDLGRLFVTGLARFRDYIYGTQKTIPSMPRGGRPAIGPRRGPWTTSAHNFGKGNHDRPQHRNRDGARAAQAA